MKLTKVKITELVITSDTILYCGDCREVLSQLPDNSVDSCVTDPPYELGFMGKKWDNTGIAYNVDLWREVYRVLKPGGHLLSFGGSRTYHRMACAIEDAGFEIRDMIDWIYGSGFPKSLDIGKAIDKLQGNERESVGIKTRPDGTQRPNMGDWEYGNANDYGNGNGLYANKEALKKANELTKGNSAYEGFGTGLKPAHEPICMARKPISEKTIAENVIKHGTGGLNIDGCRVGTEPSGWQGAGRNGDTVTAGASVGGTQGGFNYKCGEPRPSQGRFPANLIHDGSEEVVSGFPESSVTGTRHKPHIKLDAKNTPFTMGNPLAEYQDSGSTSRFFYCAKASKRDRNEGCEGLENLDPHTTYANDEWSRNNMGNTPTVKRQPVKNNHPTVKPTDLMQYLCRLVTPPHGIVLDPFMGSGSTGKATTLEGFRFIGIEMQEDYIQIARARIEFAIKQTKEAD